MFNHLRINRKRFKRDFDALAGIGGTKDGGVHRPAFSEAHLEAREWLRRTITASGLEFEQDAVGNHSGVLHSTDQAAKKLLMGSHLDSVPFGGRFDGPVGVISALEVLRTIQDNNLDLGVHLEVIDFSDEEGTLVGLLGSRALAGTLSVDNLINPRGGREALESGFRSAGISDPLAAKRSPETLLGYLEVHIEQGVRLTDAGAHIGIVTGFFGIRSYQLLIEGRADHAGTTPMDLRSDAGRGAAELIARFNRLLMDRYPSCVANFGAIRFEPGAYNIVPALAEIKVELRGPSEELLASLEADLFRLLDQVSAELGLTSSSESQACVKSTRSSKPIQKAFSQACETLDRISVPLISGAGHDAQAMSAICPSGMIFVPSTGGSHNPDEYAYEEDCFTGADVLLQAAIIFAKQCGEEPE